MVSVVLIAVLIGVLLIKLADVQRVSERTVVDMEVSVLRSELQMRIASRIVRGEDAQLLGWVGRNPVEMAWGGHDLPAAGHLSLSGQWHWDAEAGVLEYAYRQGGCLRLRLARIKPGVEGWLLGGGLILVQTYEEKNCKL